MILQKKDKRTKDHQIRTSDQITFDTKLTLFCRRMDRHQLFAQPHIRAMINRRGAVVVGRARIAPVTHQQLRDFRVSAQQCYTMINRYLIIENKV